MGILDRMSRLIRANVNDMLDRAEDPELMMNELLREMSRSITEARTQVAAMIAQEKEIEGDLQDAERDSRQWHEKAQLAVQRGRDDLAREALRRRNDAAELAVVYGGQLESQKQLVEKLKGQLRVLEAKYQEAESKRGLLIARHRRAQAQQRINETFSTLPELSAASELNRMERKIRSAEAQAEAMLELEQADIEWEFAELQIDGDIERELAALKSGMLDEEFKKLEAGDPITDSGEEDEDGNS
jgi:phage shock protein A